MFLALSLVGLAGFGALGCTAATCGLAVHHAVAHGPIRAVQIDRDPWPPVAGGERFTERLNLRLKVRGEGDFEGLRRWIERESRGEVRMETRPHREDGAAYTLLEFALPIDDRDLAEFERELEREFPGVALPDALRLDLDAR